MICQRFIKGLSVFAVLCCFAVAAQAEDDVLPVFIKSLDAVHIAGKSEPPVLKVKLTLRNNGNRGIRIRNGVFDVTMNPNSIDVEPFDKNDTDLIGADKAYLKEKLYLGKTEVESIEIAPNSMVSQVFEIRLPDRMEDRIRTLFMLVNYVGFPKASKDILMVGNATVGRQGDGGWVYKNNMSLNIRYSP